MDGMKKSGRISDWRVILLVSMFIGAMCLYTVSSYAESKGQFVGRLITEWLDDGRNMRLIERFSYKDPKRAIWDVPEGTVVNGASIPSLLWSFIGSPFGDKYRKASVIHDHYCETRTRDSEDVHRVFFDAMLDSGVGSSKAWVMYQAVRQFGPNWKLNAAVGPTCERVNGQIDFSTCTQNAQQEKPDVVQLPLDRDNLNRFIQDMKREGHEEAAEELARSLD
jgi:hypothetical protein